MVQKFLRCGRPLPTLKFLDGRVTRPVLKVVYGCPQPDLVFFDPTNVSSSSNSPTNGIVATGRETRPVGHKHFAVIHLLA